MARTRRRPARTVADTNDPAPPLDAERIVQAALQLLDERGLAGLSMRNLAQRLGIQAPSLYWYIRDKQELLGLLADAISAELRPPPPDLPWRTRLEAMAWEYRRVLRAHRDAARVLALSLPTGPHRLRAVDAVLEALLDAGFEGLVASRAGRVLVDYATSFVQDESDEAEQVSRPEQAGGAGGDPGGGGPSFPTLPAEAYPSIARLAPYLMDSDGDARFGFGLTVVLDGLEYRRASGRMSQ